MYALRDPMGANLDRIQIVKGWIEADGTMAEKVYDVTWSGDRKSDQYPIAKPRATRGKAPPQVQVFAVTASGGSLRCSVDSPV